MIRRIAYYLAAAAVALGVIAGAIQGGATTAGAPMDEEWFEPNSAAFDTPGVVLAGFKTRAGGTEIAV